MRTIHSMNRKLNIGFIAGGVGMSTQLDLKSERLKSSMP